MTRRRLVTLALAAVVAVGASVAFRAWREAGLRGGQRPAEPFRIAGSVYYVGANDVAAFLVTGPAGHVLIDGGYPRTPALIMASVERLGFRMRDVKLLLNSEPHFDHAGGLPELQRVSGAQLWASEASVAALESGDGGREVGVPPARVLAWLGITRHPPARVHRVLRDGDTIRVGPVTIVPHLTPGHTPGCTSFEIPVREGDRTLRVLSTCSLVLFETMSLVPPEAWPGIATDMARTITTLRALDPDIWVTSHARLWRRWDKFRASRTAADPVAPFIDRAGFRAYVDSGEARFRRRLAQQRREGPPVWWRELLR